MRQSSPFHSCHSHSLYLSKRERENIIIILILYKTYRESFVNKVESEIQQRKYKDISEEAAGTVRLVNLYLHCALCIYKLLHIQNNFVSLIWNVVKKKNILFY